MRIALIISIVALAGCMNAPAPNMHGSKLTDKPHPVLIRMAYPDDAEPEAY